MEGFQRVIEGITGPTGQKQLVRIGIQELIYIQTHSSSQLMTDKVVNLFQAASLVR